MSCIIVMKVYDQGMSIYNLSNLLGLDGSHYDPTARHEENDHGVVDVIVAYPQDEAEDLKDVEGIQNLEHGQGEKTLDRDDDLVVAVDPAPHRLLRA